MQTSKRFKLFALIIGLGATARIQAQTGSAQTGIEETSIVTSRHNLSASGPGPFKAMQESRICIFCHTPHRARSVAPLWNRADSRETYLAYTSTTFAGAVSQPVGSSKLCLSCHDGSIALGMVLSLSSEIQMRPGRRTLDSGDAFLGINLADDHPISFSYALSKGGQGLEYLPPGSITPPVHLDAAGMLQCTSCHDPHNDSLGNFLLTTMRYSALCTSCHIPTDWLTSAHSSSLATWSGAGEDPWPSSAFTTVAENACANCHDVHSAGHPNRLLGHSLEEDNCLVCHSGTVASKDIQSDLLKPFRHSPFLTQGTHDPTENPLLMPRHSECEDCHAPHSSRSGFAAPPGVPGPLEGTSGINSSGAIVDPINFGYELCYKCHADNHGATSTVPRMIDQLNVRLEFNPGNPSFHPIETPGVNPDVPSLLPPWTTASVISCADCHQSNTSPTFDGTGPAGPHGSIFSPLLGANYNRTDNYPESPQAYALCYRCHSRSSILNDTTFEKHDKHIRDEEIPCSACHDAHGISSTQGNSTNNSNLINFDLSIVFPLPSTGELFFRDEGFRKGSCTLLCHGEKHEDENY